MDANELFSKALGLAGGWTVSESRLDVAGRRLSLKLDFAPGSRFGCPRCGKACATHDTVVRRWRHLDFWQHETDLEARVPRTDCPEHGVLQVEVPWARPGSGFTLMMEAMILLLCQQMPVAAAARYLGETDKRLWRVVDHYVSEAHAAKDWSQLRRVLVDETSAKRGHRYATNFVDADTGELLFCTQGRDAEALGEFAREMGSHGARPPQISELVMDMSPAFMAGAAAHFAQAAVVFDHFHIMQMAGKAVDEVRKALVKGGADLRGGLWALRGNPETRSAEQLEVRARLIADSPKLGRALGLRECLQNALRHGSAEDLEGFLRWADRSRLLPFRKLSACIKEHYAGVVAFMESRLTNAAIEAVNGIIQLAKRMARGFRSFHYFRLAAYLKASRLNLHAAAL